MRTNLILAGVVVLSLCGATTGWATVIYSQDFESTAVGDDPTGWTDPGDYFGVVDTDGDHEYRVTSAYETSANAFIIGPYSGLADYTLTAEVNHTPSPIGGTPGGGGIIGRVQNDTNQYVFRVKPNLTHLTIAKRVAGAWNVINEVPISSLSASTPYLMRMVFSGTSITGKITDITDPNFTSPLGTVTGTDSTFASGGFGLRQGQGNYYDDFTVIPEPASSMLLGIGLVVGLLAYAWRKRR